MSAVDEDGFNAGWIAHIAIHVTEPVLIPRKGRSWNHHKWVRLFDEWIMDPVNRRAVVAAYVAAGGEYKDYAHSYEVTKHHKLTPHGTISHKCPLEDQAHLRASAAVRALIAQQIPKYLGKRVHG